MNQINTIDDILDISEKLLLEKLDCSEDDRLEIEMTVIPSYREKLLGIIQETLQISDNEDLTIKLLNQNTRLSLCATLERVINPEDFKVSKEISDNIRSETMKIIQEQGKQKIIKSIRDFFIVEDPKNPREKAYSKLIEFTNKEHSPAKYNFSINGMGFYIICKNLGINVEGSFNQDNLKEMMNIAFSTEELIQIGFQEKLPPKEVLINSIRDFFLIKDPKDPRGKYYSKLAEFINKGYTHALFNFNFNGMSLSTICKNLGIKVSYKANQGNFQEMLSIIFSAEELNQTQKINKKIIIKSVRDFYIIDDPKNPGGKDYSKLVELLNKGYSHAKYDFEINGMGLNGICKRLGIQVGTFVSKENYEEMLIIVFSAEELKKGGGFQEKISTKEELIKSMRNFFIIEVPENPGEKDYSKLAEFINKGYSHALFNFNFNGMSLSTICKNLGIKVSYKANQENFQEMLNIVFSTEELNFTEELNKNNLIKSIRDFFIIEVPKNPREKDYSKLTELLNKGYTHAKSNFEINGIGLNGICKRLGIQVGTFVSKGNFEEMLKIVFSAEELNQARFNDKLKIRKQ